MKKTKLTRSLMAAVSIVALSAVMYGCVHSGDDAPPPVVEPPDLSGPRQMASDAADAAKVASDAAAADLAAIAGMSDADPASYIEARDAAAAAMAAYMAAKAASDAADAAETLEDAEAAQADAEAAQADAEAAAADADMYAGMVSTAHMEAEEAARQAAEAAAAEAAALNAARTAADTAADAAEASASDAAAAVAAVMADASADQASYDMASAQATAAMEAATAARNASDAATRATTSTDAEAQRDIAQAKQMEAATASTNAMNYADMVTAAKMAADAAAAEAAALKAAKDAAKAAHDSAKMSSDAASARVMEVAGSKDVSTTAAAAYARAHDAAVDAANALLDAIAANDKAQAAATSADAEKYQAMAEAAATAAETAYMSAKGFAQIVADQQQMADDAADEAQMLADAQMKASDAATAARTAATSAREAADKIAELAGADSQAATDADTLATAAENAATAAKEASTRADADTSSADAGMEAMAAMDGQMTAETNLATLIVSRNAAQLAHDTAEREREAAAIEHAQREAQLLYDDADDGVTFHYDAVVEKAGMAADKAAEAQASAEKAVDARTRADDPVDADGNPTLDAAGDPVRGAKYRAEEARMANAEAQAALARAMTAKANADQALQDAMEATTAEDAEDALEALREANAILTEAHTGETGAGMAYMDARNAATAAKNAADTYIVGSMLRYANDDSRRASVSTAITDQAGTTGNTSGTNPSAIVTWRYHGDLGADDAVGGDAANADSEPGEGMVEMTLDPATDGNNTFTLMHNDPDTSRSDESNFTKGIGLGDFDEYHVRSVGTHVIVFTDKEQAAPPIPTETVTFDNLVPIARQMVSITAGTDDDPDTGAYDHDDNGRTEPITVDIVCPDGVQCSIQRDPNENNQIVGITGYRISTGAAGVTVMEGTTGSLNEVEDNSYLAFGVWLTGADTDTPADGVHDQFTFGAFANGSGDAPAGNIAPAPIGVEGKATYNGKAAGLHSMETSPNNYVNNFFFADAMLTADFDVTTGDDPPVAVVGGTITGKIHNIVSGGVAIPDPIHLYVSAGEANNANINADGTFDGSARMGAGTTDSTTGNITYPYNGTWSGQLYNQPAEDRFTAVLEATETPPLSAAGTFGVTGADNRGTPDDESDDLTSSFVGAFGAHRDE